MKCVAHINGPKRMNCTGFGDVLICSEAVSSSKFCPLNRRLFVCILYNMYFMAYHGSFCLHSETNTFAND